MSFLKKKKITSLNAQRSAGVSVQRSLINHVFSGSLINDTGSAWAPGLARGGHVSEYIKSAFACLPDGQLQTGAGVILITVVSWSD